MSTARVRGHWDLCLCLCVIFCCCFVCLKYEKRVLWYEPNFFFFSGLPFFCSSILFFRFLFFWGPKMSRSQRVFSVKGWQRQRRETERNREKGREREEERSIHCAVKRACERVTMLRYKLGKKEKRALREKSMPDGRELVLFCVLSFLSVSFLHCRALSNCGLRALRNFSFLSLSSHFSLPCVQSSFVTQPVSILRCLFFFTVSSCIFVCLLETPFLLFQNLSFPLALSSLFLIVCVSFFLYFSRFFLHPHPHHLYHRLVALSLPLVHSFTPGKSYSPKCLCSVQ